MISVKRSYFQCVKYVLYTHVYILVELFPKIKNL